VEQATQSGVNCVQCGDSKRSNQGARKVFSNMCKSAKTVRGHNARVPEGRQQAGRQEAGAMRRARHQPRANARRVQPNARGQSCTRQV